MRLNWSIEITYITVLTFVFYLREPLTSSLSPCHPKISGFVAGIGFSDVLGINRRRGLSEIAPSVVALIPIDVVNILRGPRAGYM